MRVCRRVVPCVGRPDAGGAVSVRAAGQRAVACCRRALGAVNGGTAEHSLDRSRPARQHGAVGPDDRGSRVTLAQPLVQVGPGRRP